MATVIDSLIVELGLDPSNFSKGQKKAAEEIVKTKKDAERAAKEMEESGKQAARFFSQIRNQVLALFAAFELGRGLKEFISQMTRADAMTGRVAKTLDMTGRQLGSWQGSVELVGGSAEGITASMQGLNGELQNFLLTGQSNVIPYFRALGISIVDNNGHVKTANDLFLELADSFSKMDPARAAAFGRALGFDQGTINLLIMGRKAVEDMLTAERKLAPTAADIAAAQARQRSFVLLDQTLTSIGRTILTMVTPAITQVLDGMRRWLEVNREWLQQKVAEYVKKFADWIQHIDWNKVSTDLHSIAQAAGILVHHLGGVVHLSETFFALWALSKIAAVVGGIGSLAGALTSVAAVGLGGGALAVIGALAGIGAGGAVLGAWLNKEGPLQDALKAGSDVDYSQTEDEVKGAEHIQAGLSSWYGAGMIAQHGGMSPRDAEAYIRQQAIARGIDPDVAVQVAKSEGLYNYVGDRGSSFGPYQLHMGGLAGGGMAVGGLGDEFKRQTGMDPRDPRTEKAQIQFALDQAKLHGWGAWHGWKGSAFAGIGGTHHTTVETHVGEVHVHTQATDANGIARDIGPAIKRTGIAVQANSGAN